MRPLSVITHARWSNLAKFLPIVRARIVSGYLAESGQFCAKCKTFNFSAQVRRKCETVVLGESLLNMTSVMSKILCVSENIFSFDDYQQGVGGWSASYGNRALDMIV
jgi:hypothetical protein